MADPAIVSTVAAPAPGPPLWLLLELTYKCPLHCAFCYNPTNYVAGSGPELETADWLRVLREARAMGAVQLGLSGGEPLSRDDLEVIVAEARQLGFYTNLITSGVGLTDTRIRALKAAGLDGGGSVAADAQGNVYAFWHAPKPGNTNGEAGRAVFVARSTDDGKTFAPEKLATRQPTGACGCCGRASSMAR